MKEEEILGILPLHIRTIIKQAGINWDELQEIRLRIQKAVILKYNAKTCYLSEQGKITTRKEQLHIVTSQEIRQAMEYISSYSMYAYIEQLKQGYYEHPRQILCFFYYPSDEYLTYLMTVDEMMFTDEIDCSDLFGGNSERERIMIFEIGQ